MQTSLIYNEMLITVRMCSKESELVSVLEKVLNLVNERRDKVLNLLKYSRAVTGLLEKPAVIEERLDEKFKAKGASLMNAVLSENIAATVDSRNQG